MNRRNFLLTLTGSTLALAGGIKGLALSRDYSLASLLAELRSLSPTQLTSHGAWSVSEIFQHCAQSIRYSRTGYPEAKSALFQHTAGAAALNVFTASGGMTHALDEPIPGSPTLTKELSNDTALAELIHELEQFIAWSGELAPHFAYGRLSKAQYAAAHYLHVRNHWGELGVMVGEGLRDG